MKKHILPIVFTACFALTGCGQGAAITESTAATADTSGKTSVQSTENKGTPLTADELNDLTEFFNQGEIMDIVRANHYDDSQEQYILDSYEPGYEYGEYKCTSGTKDENILTVKVEVTDGDNPAELVFPARDIVLKKQDNSYHIISNEYDYETGCTPALSFETEIKPYGKVNIYTYHQYQLADIYDVILFVQNNDQIDRIIPHDNLNNAINNVESIDFYDYNADGYDDAIIIGKAGDKDKILLCPFDQDQFGSIDTELSNKVESKVSSFTFEEVKKALSEI